MVVIRGDTILNKQEYFDIGMQYYLTGRVAFIDQLYPVAGNLFHHSTEMFLKAALMPGNSPDDLFKKFRHNIIELWNEFIKVSSNSDTFNDFITELSKWDDLRYPEKRDGDVVMHFRMEKTKSGLGFQDIPGRKSTKYELSLEEMDEFFEHMVDISIVQKDLVKAFLEFGVGNRMVDDKEFNKHVVGLLS